MEAFFPKGARLRKRREFERVGRQGNRIVGSKLILDTLFTSDEKARLGITVTKKFGKAHERNRFKRCVREAFRHLAPQLPQGMWLNIRPRHKEIVPSSRAIQEELIQLMKLGYEPQ